ncbi:Aldo/keto reductase family [Phytophthora infestans]|uniref:Aldo/keto reductase family n=1 Tax=Phytophthora infestans TaxID=4787 RepID=A0A833WN72_PHYIN|nr:Aldo/keto reductase family [Phytophthora infestans]KAF4145991.1 Aldo/keto reductase family [Phytophthora infestans]
MSVNVPTKILPSGARIPMIGLGVYQSEPGPETYNAILTSLKLGYRHIDTAEIYGNEEDVGRAVRDSGIPREEIFVTTKLFTTNWGYSKALAAGKASNDRLGIVYIYLYLLHAPGPPKERADTWRAVEDLREQETLRDIGVSNFNETLLATLRKTAHIKPAVNQDNDIIMEAYSPLARATKMDDPALVSIADETGATPGQVLVAFGVANGFVTLRIEIV